MSVRMNAAGINTFNAKSDAMQNKHRAIRHEITSVFWVW